MFRYTTGIPLSTVTSSPSSARADTAANAVITKRHITNKSDLMLNDDDLFMFLPIPDSVVSSVMFLRY